MQILWAPYGSQTGHLCTIRPTGSSMGAKTQRIRLPEELIDQTEEAMDKIGGYKDTSEYIRDAIRRRNLEVLRGGSA